MSDIKIVIGAEVAGAEAGLRRVQGELAKTATASNTSATALNSFASNLKGIGSSLISGGILTGIALLGAGLVKLAQDVFGLTKEQQRLNDVLGESKGAYVKATLEVEKMKVAFEQAKTGVITKEEALKLYNTTIGKTIGQTKDLDEAEAKLIAQGENYIRFTLLKAAANIALGKAAEAAFKAEQERIEGPKKVGILDRIGAGRFGGPTPEMIQANNIKKALAEENNFRKIALSLQEKAKQFGFDYNGLVEKDVKLQKEKVKVLKEQKVVQDRVLESVFAPGKVKAPEGPAAPLTPQIVVKPTPIFDNSAMMKGLLDWIKEMRVDELSEQFSNLVTDALNQGAIQAADMLGETLAGVVESGKFDLPNLFGGLMQNLGTQLQDLGKFLVVSSGVIKAAKEAFKKLLANPTAALVVGAGLVLLGAAIKASAKKKYEGFATGVRNFGGGAALVGERGPEMVYLPKGSSVQPNNELNAYGGGGITLMPSIKYEGDGFRVMLNRVDARWSRNN